MAQQEQTERQQLAAQLARIGNPCSCRLQADCRQLMDQLAYRGVLPSAVLTMTDQEWLDGCTVVQARVSGQGP